MIRVGILYTRLALNGLRALGMFESENGLTINEINQTMGLRSNITTTHVNPPQRMVKHILEQVMIKA